MSNLGENQCRSAQQGFLNDTNNNHKRKSLNEQDEYAVVKQFIDLNDNKKSSMLPNYKANIFLNANISTSPTNYRNDYFKQNPKDGEKQNNEIRNISLYKNTPITQNKIPLINYQMHKECFESVVESPITDLQRRQLTLIRKKTPSYPRPQNKIQEQKNMFKSENKKELDYNTSHDAQQNSECKNTNIDVHVTLKNPKNLMTQTLQHEPRSNEVQIAPRKGFLTSNACDEQAMKLSANKSLQLIHTNSPKSVYTECFAKAHPQITYKLEKENSQNKLNYETRNIENIHYNQQELSCKTQAQKSYITNNTHSSHIMMRNASNPSKVSPTYPVETVRNRSTPDNAKNVTTVVNLNNLENAYEVYHTNNLNNVIIVKNIIHFDNANKASMGKEGIHKFSESNLSNVNRTLSNPNELKPGSIKNNMRNVSSPSNCNSYVECRRDESTYTSSHEMHRKMKVADPHTESHISIGLKRMSSSVDAIKYKTKDVDFAQWNQPNYYKNSGTNEIQITNREHENTKRESAKHMDDIRLDSSNEEEYKPKMNIKQIVKNNKTKLERYEEESVIDQNAKHIKDFNKEKRERNVNMENQKMEETEKEKSSYTNMETDKAQKLQKNKYDDINERPIVVRNKPFPYNQFDDIPINSEHNRERENKNKRASFNLIYGNTEIGSFVDINGNIVHMFQDEKKLRASRDDSLMREEREEAVENIAIEERYNQHSLRENHIVENRNRTGIEKVIKTKPGEPTYEKGYPMGVPDITIDYNSNEASLENILKTVEKETKVNNVSFSRNTGTHRNDCDLYKKSPHEREEGLTGSRREGEVPLHESNKWTETSNHTNPHKNSQSKRTVNTRGNYGIMNESANSYTTPINNDSINNNLNQSCGVTVHAPRKIVAIPSKHKVDKVSYVNFHELPDFPNAITPEYRNNLVNDIIEKSKDQEWTKQIEYMIELRKVLKYYPKAFFEEHIKDLRRIVRVLVEFLNSPRSCVSKNSLLCLTEFYSAGSKKTDCTIEDVILPCLKKAHQTSVDFINTAANNTLLAICDACTESKLIQQFVKIMTSKTKTFNLLCLRYLIAVLLKFDEHIIKYKEVNKVVEAIFECTSGGSAEIKCTARVALVVLENICPIKKLCGKNVSSEMLRKIEVLVNKTTDEDLNTVLGKITLH